MEYFNEQKSCFISLSPFIAKQASLGNNLGAYPDGLLLRGCPLEVPAPPRRDRSTKLQRMYRKHQEYKGERPGGRQGRQSRFHHVTLCRSRVRPHQAHRGGRGDRHGLARLRHRGELFEYVAICALVHSTYGLNLPHTGRSQRVPASPRRGAGSPRAQVWRADGRSLL